MCMLMVYIPSVLKATHNYTPIWATVIQHKILCRFTVTQKDTVSLRKFFREITVAEKDTVILHKILCETTATEKEAVI